MIFPFFLNYRCNKLLERAKKLKGCTQNLEIKTNLEKIIAAKIVFKRKNTWEVRKIYAARLEEASKVLDNFVNPLEEKRAYNSHEENNFKTQTSELSKTQSDDAALPHCHKSPISQPRRNTIDSSFKIALFNIPRFRF